MKGGSYVHEVNTWRVGCDFVCLYVASLQVLQGF